jgi:ferredoxin
MMGPHPTNMPNLLDRLARNQPGAFYVDSSCIDCDYCRANAPGVFSRDEETGLSFVHRQPVTPDEIAQADDALSTCPSESIGRDGVTADSPAVAAKP